MDSLLSLPVYVVTPVLVIFGVTVVYVVLKALREGREVSFWPPRIGPRQTAESGEGSAQKSSASQDWNEDAFSAAIASPGTLYVESGSIVGATFALTTSAQSYLFGSIPSCDFVLPNVSRAQFRIHVLRQPGPTSSSRPYNLELQGMGSPVDLWVDGVSARGISTPLNNNSVIETGGLKIRVVKLPS
jgi:hypothetical protein